MPVAAEERLVVALEARIRDFEKNMAKGRKIANDNLRAIEKRAQESAPRLEAALANAGKGLVAGLSMGLGAVGVGGAGIAGVLTTIKQAVSEVAEMSAEAKRAGLGVEAFQELKFAAEQARVGVDGLTDGIKEMQLRADEFIVTGAGGGAEAFQRLGYTADELKVKLKDPAALFGEVIERLRDLDKASQIRVADEIFGGTGGEQFVRFLEMGRNSIERMRQEARDTGAVLDAEMVKRAEEIDRRFQALATTIGTKVKGAILGIIELLQEMQKHLPTPDELPQRSPAWSQAQPQATPRTRATTFDVGLPSGSTATANVPLPTPRPAGLAGQGDLSNVKRAGETLKRGYADLQAAAQQRIADLQTEQAALGMTTQAAEAYRFKQQAIAEAQRMQITLTPEQTQQLDDLAQQYGTLSAALETAYADQQRLNQAQQELGSIASSTISGLIDGTQSWGESLANITKRLADLVLQAALLGDGPLGGLFGMGATGGKAGGLIGTLFSAFGFAEGGVMTPHGPRRLKRYANGGVSNTAAIFGEAGPEAAVPLPDGRRIPVELNTPRAGASRGQRTTLNANISINLAGANGDAAIAKAAQEAAAAGAAIALRQVPALAVQAVQNHQKRYG
ncbi:hypothetical protein J5J86_20685 [Aquabacter sp. L1I39]|uniref:hypothetical protein n=1 Tax=Aquabacter sp. L1I39 TaxID=2820278 RepID=UPI001ADCAA0E|nr:hypothetical protein [Aquabacter sp. L1I39]QTL03143.1 hypothetical protein J5J86_20685 [Aquabacter sp. L1I39]